jgi:hypothetical protein
LIEPVHGGNTSNFGHERQPFCVDHLLITYSKHTVFIRIEDDIYNNKA